jgi:hypothetical protein
VRSGSQGFFVISTRRFDSRDYFAVNKYTGDETLFVLLVEQTATKMMFLAIYRRRESYAIALLF